MHITPKTSIVRSNGSQLHDEKFLDGQLLKSNISNLQLKRAERYIFAGLLLVTSIVSLSSVSALASDKKAAKVREVEPNLKFAAPNLKPATRYSGRTPIDLTNGMLGNNGTIGLDNPAYEIWSEKTVAVGMSERSYPFSEKARFTENLNERLNFFDQAIWNWSRVSDITKPEVVEYAKAATAKLTPMLETAKKDAGDASASNESTWTANQDRARKSFLDLQAAYYAEHKNTIR
jgi:hypothetical protein